MGWGWWFAENASGTSLPSQKVVQKLAAEVWKSPGTKSARSCMEQACITELVDKILMMELARCYIYDFSGDYSPVLGTQNHMIYNKKLHIGIWGDIGMV